MTTVACPLSAGTLCRHLSARSASQAFKLLLQESFGFDSFLGYNALLIFLESTEKISTQITFQLLSVKEQFRLQTPQKFECLLNKEREHRVNPSPMQGKWVINLSSRELQEDKSAVLPCGLNFAVAPRVIPVPYIIAMVENGLRSAKVTQEIVDATRTTVVGVLQKTRLPPRNLTPAESRALQTLQSDDDIVSVPADKGRATVVMDKLVFEHKVEDLLSDHCTYKVLPRDPTSSLEGQMNELLLTLKKSGVLPDKLYYRLRSSAGECPLLYGLPKVHKPDFPLRPIVSFVNSPTYYLSKHLVSLLAPLVGNSPTHVNNSIQFVSFISMQTLGLNQVLVSFDVVSLFTNVPVDLACQITNNRLCGDSTLNDRTSLSINQVVTLLRFCLSATYLAYRGKFYQQTFGTAMGSPISVVVANLGMEDVEERALSSAPHRPPFWKRYMDDVCTVVDCDDVGGFCEHLNSIEPSINFTFELEQDHKLPFLDVEIFHHSNSSLSTKVYRKTTHMDKYLQFDSHHPLAHKLAVTKTLYKRASTHCTIVEDAVSEGRHVSKALIGNEWLSQEA